MKKLIKAFLNKETILYLVFGVLTTAVSFVTLKLFDVALGKELYLVSNSLSWILSVAFAYVTNKLFVFESKSFKVKIFFSEAIKFFAARGITGIVEVLLPLLLIAIGLDQSIFGVEGFAAKITSTIVVIILNYILSKKVVFKK